jgi:hypothetical protein
LKSGWPLALAVLAAGISVAAYGIATYEAWWTIAFAVGGFAPVVAVGRRGTAGTIAIGIIVSFSIAVATLGLFLLWMGLHGPARPCPPDVCSDAGPGLLAAGIAGLALAVLTFGLTIRYARR